MPELPTIKTARGKLDLRQARLVRRKFSKYVRRYRGMLIMACVAALGATIAELAAPWTIKAIFDYVLTDAPKDRWLGRVLHAISTDKGTMLLAICVAIVVIALFDALFSYLRDVLLAKAGQMMVGDLRQDVFDHLQKLPPAEFEERRTGDLLTRLSGDVTMLRQMLCDALVTVGQGVLIIVAMAAAMFWLNPLLTLIALAIVPPTAWVTLRISRDIRKAARRAREKESEVASIAHDVLGAMAVVQAFNREKVERDRFGRQNRSSVRAGVRTTRLEAKLYRVVSITSAVALCGILYVGVRAVLKHEMTAGDLLVFLAYLRAMAKPVRRISKVTGAVAKATTCGQRVTELLAIRPAIKDRDDAVAMPPVRGVVAFDGVSFNYPNGTPALRDLSLTIQAGERVAIVGPSGAGKSTLIKLLLRFYDPASGSVAVDGHDLRSVTLASLRRQIGWVHQDTVLFSLTVRENIALGKQRATDEEIVAAARRVHADEFIEQLPRGYDTPLGQSALTLSGGQRQRLALARALLREPALLLLDEPATGLDAVTRRQVSEVWLSSDHRATTLVICHRLVEMERFDRVILISGGRVVAAAPHAALLESCPAYARLYEIDSHQGEPQAQEAAPC